MIVPFEVTIVAWSAMGIYVESKLLLHEIKALWPLDKKEKQSDGYWDQLKTINEGNCSLHFSREC